MVELSITPALADHGAGFDAPFSNPVFPINCWVELPPLLTVRLMGTDFVWPPPDLRTRDEPHCTFPIPVGRTVPGARFRKRRAGGAGADQKEGRVTSPVMAGHDDHVKILSSVTGRSRTRFPVA